MSGSQANSIRLGKKDFAAFKTKSDIARCGSLLIFRTKTERPLARLGITMKGKFGSVDRHAAKRILREGFKLYPDLFCQGFDYNIVLKSEVAKGKRRFLGALGRYKLKQNIWASFDQKPNWKPASQRAH